MLYFKVKLLFRHVLSQISLQTIIRTSGQPIVMQNDISKKRAEIVCFTNRVVNIKSVTLHV